MLDPESVLNQARQGTAPPGWRVFTRKRSRLGGFLRGTSEDPDPLLVITPDGAVEYTSSRKPVAVVDFDSLSRIKLRITGSSFSDSTIVSLDVWLDLHHRDGTRARWRSDTFPNEDETVQAFIEAYGAHQALRSGGLYPQ